MMAEILQEGRDGGDEYHEGDESGQYEDEEILNTWLGELNTLKKVGRFPLSITTLSLTVILTEHSFFVYLLTRASSVDFLIVLPKSPHTTDSIRTLFPAPFEPPVSLLFPSIRTMPFVLLKLKELFLIE